MSLFYLNPKSIALGKTLATAGLLASLAQALPAQSATLSWAAVKSGNPTLFVTTGSATGKFLNATNNNIAVSGGGTFNLTFGSIADISISNPSRTSGISSQFVSNTPRIDTTLNGLSTSNQTLYLQENTTTANQALYAGIKFNTTGGVSGVSFTLYDVDNATGNNWQDRVIVRGSLNGAAVSSTATPNTAANISINGVGTTYGSVTGATVLDGLKNIGNDSDAANVTISFTGPIDQLYIDFTQAPGSLNTTDPDSHGIGIGNITYQAVPEPLTLLGAMTAFGFGAAFKRRSAQSQKKS